jgi:hypothetical protein
MIAKLLSYAPFNVYWAAPWELSVLQSNRGPTGMGASSNAITPCVDDAWISRLELMLCGALLGKSPLASTSFANLAINEKLEATPDPNTTD